MFGISTAMVRGCCAKVGSSNLHAPTKSKAGVQTEPIIRVLFVLVPDLQVAEGNYNLDCVYRMVQNRGPCGGAVLRSAILQHFTG